MSAHVVEVRALERDGRSGTYQRGGRTWAPGWHEAVVDDQLLALISADPWLEVRVLDLRLQAAKKMEYALAADTAAKAAEAHAHELRQHADGLLSEAEQAFDAAGREPPPAPPPAPTPYKDAMRAAMPGHVRAEVDAQKSALVETRGQITDARAQAGMPDSDHKNGKRKG